MSPKLWIEASEAAMRRHAPPSSPFRIGAAFAVLALAAAVFLTSKLALHAQENAASSEAERSRDAGSQRGTNLRTGLPAVLPETPESLASNDPTRSWHQALNDYRDQMRRLQDLSDAQMNLLDQIRQRRDASEGSALTLHKIAPRYNTKQLIAQLHANYAEVEQTRQQMTTIAQRLVDNAARIHEAMVRILDAPRPTPRPSDSQRAYASSASEQRWRAQLNEACALIEEAQADPAHAVEIMKLGIERILEARERRGVQPEIRRLVEEASKIEREQRYLRERLESNEGNLRELRRQIDSLIEKRRDPYLLESQETPNYPEVYEPSYDYGYNSANDPSDYVIPDAAAQGTRSGGMPFDVQTAPPRQTPTPSGARSR